MNTNKNTDNEMMNTQVKKVDAMHPDMDIMREAGEIIRQGGLVGFPTETVYGLGADALLPEGAKRIYAAK
ncbi:L-threonylcarbamoyladenylate synthase, partial [Eubacterium sp.]